MIYYPHSSQEVMHCDTSYKFLAILKVKVTAICFCCCYFKSVLEIANVVYLQFLSIIYYLSFHQSPKCNSNCWFVSHEVLTVCYSRTLLWFRRFVFIVSSRRLGFDARKGFVWFVVDILVLRQVFFRVLQLFLVSIILPMLRTQSFHSSVTDPLHPWQLSTYENIPY